MSDRVKSNSMQDVFHAAGNSANINFGKYAPKDKANPLGAREMSEAIQAIADSNYNTGEYAVEYSDENKARARENINAANNSGVVRKLSDGVANSYNNVNHVNGSVLNVDGILKAGKSSSNNAIINRGALRGIISSGNCIISGLDFAQRFVEYLPDATLNTTNHTISFGNGNNPTGSSFAPYGGYKENTQYTIILRIRKTGDTANSTVGLRSSYVGGGYSQCPSLTGDVTKFQTLKFTTTANKTVRLFEKVYQSGAGNYVIDYDTFALYEGDVEIADYHDYDGKASIVKFPTVEGFKYAGGKYDVADGSFVPYKYYASYDGETLSGEWLSSLDTYEEGATPTTGAEVVDLASFDEENAVEFTPFAPVVINGEKANVFFDFCDANVTYEENVTNILLDLAEEIADILDEITDIKSSMTSLDARVTALENTPAPTTEINPENSTLEIDRPEINTLDPEISTSDVEPTEPTENM